MKKTDMREKNYKSIHGLLSYFYLMIFSVRNSSIRNPQSAIRNSKSGFTIVEVIIVVLLIALLAWAIFPLLKTSFDSWEIADRREEVIQTGRLALDKMFREIRRADDLTNASWPTYIDFKPVWASSTEYRFDYATASYDIAYGTWSSPTFSSDSLAAPVDSFSYLTYTRRLATAVTFARRVNALRFALAVSDERQRLPDSINPMNSRTMVQMRQAREGFFYAKSTAYATQSFSFDRSNCENFCVKVFNDRFADPASIAAAGRKVTVSWAGGSSIVYPEYDTSGAYFATCCSVGTTVGCAAPACNMGPCIGGGGNCLVKIEFDDGSEQMTVNDQIRVQN
ncbi:MAG: type II secretion system protein [bacterium]